MTPAESTVAKIRLYLQRGTSANIPLEEVAAEHAAAVQAVNDRLDQCESYLKAGLLTEAVHFAHVAPPVLDEVVTLEFPEKEEFAALCEQSLGLRPPSVRENGAIYLDEAMVQYDGLAPTLAKHRLMAIGRAPIASRIHMLRALSQQDSTPHWADDLRHLERERHKELDVRIRTLYAQRLYADVVAACDEVLGPWMETPSATLRKLAEDGKRAALREMEQSHRQGKVARWEAEIVDLEARIAEAYGAGDEAQLGPLVERHAKVAERLQRPVADEVRAAAAWLADLHQNAEADGAFHAAAQRLEAALDERRPAEELERLWSALLRHERPVPDTLRHRYQGRLEDLRLAKGRKFRLVLVAVLGGLLVLGGGIGAATVLGQRSAERDRWKGEIAAAVKDAAWPRASQLLADAKAKVPALAEDPEVRAMQQRTDEAMASEKTRSGRFASLMKGLEEAGPSRPSLESLATATQTATSDEEKMRVEQFKLAVEKAKAAAQEVVDEKVRQELAEFTKRYNAMDRSAPRFSQEVGELGRKIRALADTPGLSMPQRDAVLVLWKRVVAEYTGNGGAQ